MVYDTVTILLKIVVKKSFSHHTQFFWCSVWENPAKAPEDAERELSASRVNICAHVKDPVVHVRVRWIMETLKHPACTVGWVTRLCRSWLSPGKATRISHGRNPTGTIRYG